jgi:ABC-type spermidine/putrescine transport system permease subunit II
MQEVLKLLIGVVALLLAVPIGNSLAKVTKRELKAGKKYFRWLIFFGLILGVVGLILGNDALLFTGFFIAIVTSRSVKK